MQSNNPISKKKKFVADGVFRAELNEFLKRSLAEEGYSGVEVRPTPVRTEIIIRATRTKEVLGEKGQRVRELTSLVQKRFGFPENSVEIYAERVENRALCAMAQAESLRYKLIGGLAVRRAAYGVLRYVMNAGAKGCEVVVSGKLRGQRAKSMKFKDGYIITTGEPNRQYVDSAIRNVLMRQGILGIKVKIMLAHDPQGKIGPSKPLPDSVPVHEPKPDMPLPPHTLADFKPPATDSPMMPENDYSGDNAMPPQQMQQMNMSQGGMGPPGPLMPSPQQGGGGDGGGYGGQGGGPPQPQGRMGPPGGGAQPDMLDDSTEGW
eukprot:Filipodium_phascolosomae@DN1934_c0_g1_i1.p1